MSDRLRSVSLVVCGTGLMLAACDGAGGRGGPDPAGPPGTVAARPASQTLQAATGLTQIPRPDFRQLEERIAESYPDDLRAAGRHGAVLLDVDVDETGAVREVTVVPRPEIPGGAHVRAVALVRDPRTGKTVEEELPDDYDDAFGPAAREAVRGTRFTPAIRSGMAVPYRLRMTVRFGSPPASR